ncbi:MAG: OmpH family outer membrane protein [Kiritimatiellia bacterium]
MNRPLLLALSMLMSLCAIAAQTIAVVDMEAVLAKHPNTPNDKKQLELTMEDYSKERDTLKADIQAKEEDLRKKIQEAQNPMLAPAKADELKKACAVSQGNLERDYRAAEMQMQKRGRDLSDLEQRLIKRTSAEISAHIAAYAKDKNFDIVLYKNITPYVSDSCDITDEIIVLCGAVPDKKDTSKAGKELNAPATLTKSKPAPVKNIKE